jgi:hypothetical protein
MDVIPFPAPPAPPGKTPKPPERVDRAYMIVAMFEDLRDKPDDEVKEIAPVIMEFLDLLWRGHVIRRADGKFVLTTRGKAAAEAAEE